MTGNTAQERVIVDVVTKYGIKANGINYNLSPRLQGDGATPQDFVVGGTYLLEVWTGPKGGRSINAFKLVGEVVKSNVSSTLPSLPPTSLPATKAPGGIPPVAPARKIQDKVVDEDKMTKADWADRNRSIELQAIIKSVLESPALAQMSVGKNQLEVFTLKTAFFKSALEDYDNAKGNTL